MTNRARGAVSMEFGNVESVKLWGFQGTDPDDDHHHIQVKTSDGCSQSADISKEEFERIEGLLASHRDNFYCPECGDAHPGGSFCPECGRDLVTYEEAN